MLDAYASGRDEKTARYLKHRFDYIVRDAFPPDALTAIADCVMEAERRTGGLLAFAPLWVQKTRGDDAARLYARLYFTAWVLGMRGRCFEMAQNATGTAYGVDGRTVRDFLKKARRRGFIEVAAASKGVPGHYRTAHIYRLAHSDCQRAMNDAEYILCGLAGDRLPHTR